MHKNILCFSLQQFPSFDTLISNRWKEGDEKGCEDIFKVVRKCLQRFVLFCIVYDEEMKSPQVAEDAVSEAVLAAYENIYSLRKDEAFRSWIFKILLNICKKKLKKRLC